MGANNQHLSQTDGRCQTPHRRAQRKPHSGRLISIQRRSEPPAWCELVHKLAIGFWFDELPNGASQFARGSVSVTLARTTGVLALSESSKNFLHHLAPGEDSMTDSVKPSNAAFDSVAQSGLMLARASETDAPTMPREVRQALRKLHSPVTIGSVSASDEFTNE